MPSKNIKAIIFDMDGVLVNTEPMHIEIEKDLFKRLNLSISEKEHATYLGRSTEAMWTELSAKYNLSQSASELIELNKSAIINYLSYTDSIPIMQGVEAALDRICNLNLPIALASSSDIETIDLILERTGLKRYFLHRVSAGNVGKSKPAPDIFLYTADLLNVRPEDCLVVEDSENGIAAAKAANMICVAYKGVNSPPVDQSKADDCITDFAQLDNILRKYIV